MAKGIKLSEFEKGEITPLKRVGKSQKEISKALGRSRTVICNYLKSTNKYETSKPTGRREELKKKELKKKENFVNVKNSEISTRCFLQY